MKQTSNGTGKAYSILLVEDEPGLQKTLSLLLTLEGYEVRCAADGRSALESLAAHAPDLMITDYMMPRMDGIHLIEQIRGDPRFAALPVIFQSAVSLDADQFERLEADVKLQKPVDWKLLRQLVREILHRHPA